MLTGIQQHDQLMKTIKWNLVLLYRLTVMDFRKRFLGAMLGSLWALMSPLVTILLIYFVMTYGLRVTKSQNVSFIDWLIPGMLAWFYIMETLSITVGAIVENRHLVTKIRFPLYLLPIAKTLSPLIVHIFLICLFTLYLVFVGTPSWCWLQILYYMFASVLLCLGISYFTSAAMVFVRDIANVIGVALQICFWATPIFWDSAMLTGTKMKFILLSPLNYIISGYRDSLLGNVWFWQKPMETVIFWVCALAILISGIIFFRLFCKHFADVL